MDFYIRLANLMRTGFYQDSKRLSPFLHIPHKIFHPAI